uniref:Uncharacterized protein n=1 Tax=Fagus sylvatica TaxID=28930 RepID=A0A2N9H9E4_FAGSY
MLMDGIQRCLEDRDETARQGRAVAEVDTKPEILNVKPDPEPVPEETFAGSRQQRVFVDHLHKRRVQVVQAGNGSGRVCTPGAAGQ